MNCRETTSLILTERDGALSQAQRAALSDHLKVCPACEQLRVRVASAMDDYAVGIASIATPDADETWRELQARLSQPVRKRRLAPVIWFGAPLAAAAAVALAFLTLNPSVQPPAQKSPPAMARMPTEVARADYVEAGDVNASTMVYVDKESGWLVVWATSVDTKTSG
jgi:anti-sigma factor RsiW